MRGVSFKSSSGNAYSYDDSTGVIFPAGKNGGRNPLKNIPITPLLHGKNSDPGARVEPSTLEEHLLGNAHGFRHLILEVTPQCNLRCKYCVFSDHYIYSRSYNGAMMDFRTAKKAVDYYMKNFERIHYRNPNSSPIIGFYGGEPLLNWKVVRQVVSYVNEEYKPKYDSILYTITTNGLLFDDEVQDFLVDNDFSIIVSLDGNKENHDRNRVKGNGEGSYNDVFGNITKFQKKYPDYTRFAISSCYDYKTDMFKLKTFFDSTNLFLVNISQIDVNNTTYYQNFSEEDKEKFENSFQKFKEMFLEQAKNNEIKKNSFIYSYIGVFFANFAFHPMIREDRPRFVPFTGTCVPGEKLYVTPQGKIHICERINQHFPIGDIDNGLNFARMAKIVENYNRSICTNCGECPVSRFCSACYAVFATDQSFAKNKAYCENFQNSVKDSLKSYVDVVEVRPDILDELTVDYYQNILEKVGYIVE